VTQLYISGAWFPKALLALELENACRV